MNDFELAAHDYVLSNPRPGASLEEAVYLAFTAGALYGVKRAGAAFDAGIALGRIAGNARQVPT